MPIKDSFVMKMRTKCMGGQWRNWNSHICHLEYKQVHFERLYVPKIIIFRELPYDSAIPFQYICRSKSM